MTIPLIRNSSLMYSLFHQSLRIQHDYLRDRDDIANFMAVASFPLAECSAWEE